MARQKSKRFSREQLRLALMAFSFVFGSALLVQGAHYAVKTATAESLPDAPNGPSIDYSKFRKASPATELPEELAGENLRGSMN